MFITKIVKRVRKGEKGFTLIELLVVMAILAILVGLVVPNFFGVTDESDAIMMQGQHEKMREAVYLYHEDTGEWPTEWSGAPIGAAGHELWFPVGVGGWDGPYIDRPILQKNPWGGNWGVMTVSLGNVTVGASAANFTALAYDGVPEVVRLQVDRAMDDRSPGTGAVQTFPPAALGAAGRLIIIIGPMH